MPIKFVDYQRDFTLRLSSDGLPLGQVITLGKGRWLTVCPMCGCGHDVTTFKGDVYTPKCIVKVTHKHVYANWLQKHPDAARCKRVLLELKPVQIVPEKPKKAKKPANPAVKTPNTAPNSEPKMLTFVKVAGARVQKSTKSVTPPGTKNLRFPRV